MIGVSKLYCGAVEPSDLLRYGRKSADLPSHLLQFSEDKKPVVVWNLTRACNLSCAHCYAAATPGPAPDELTRDEAFGLVDHLTEYGVPVILFSGGEPLLHPHIFELIERTVRRGSRAVLSSNGLLLTPDSLARLRDAGLSYAGLSLDGLGEAHDRLRRLDGAFDLTIKAVREARLAGLKVGLRLTLTKLNQAELPGLFDLMEAENLPRICFYHLVGTGRGRSLAAEALSHDETRHTVDLIADRARRLQASGFKPEILTVDNQADGPYLYLKARREGDTNLAGRILELLRLNGGNSAGHGIAAISWNGEVHPDQFWRSVVLGSVKNQPFAEIWHNPDHELLMALKNKKAHLTGRCRLCVFLDMCGGGLRARAAAAGDLWGPDPACYLTDEEISTELAKPSGFQATRA